ncbi:MAG: hypothetical protein JOZ77_05880 [Candidatus Eremiobacteraeota bacterium]|nr:hypothetical protein [Candidatus Eremiobacteraeota bacterium]
MERALREGDRVILSTGAVATVRRSYPAGYSGPVDILLDGVEESDRSDALTLLEVDVSTTGEDGGSRDSEPRSSGGESRGQSVKMED